MTDLPTAPPTQDERTWALVAHLSGPATALFSSGLAFVLGPAWALIPFLAPLIIWLAKRDASEFVARQAKEALNFHLTLLLAVVAFVVAALAFVVGTFGFGLLVALPAWWIFSVALYLAAIVLGCIAAFEAFKGRPYRYPVTLRLIR